MKTTASPVPVITDSEIDPALATEVYIEPPELTARLNIEEGQEQRERTRHTFLVMRFDVLQTTYRKLVPTLKGRASERASFFAAHENNMERGFGSASQHKRTRNHTIVSRVLL